VVWGRLEAAPDLVELEGEEADEGAAAAPAVADLLQEAERAVGPLDVVVGPLPQALRAVEVSCDLAELGGLQAADRLGQFGDREELRVARAA
jgi:hypothetical protein